MVDKSADHDVDTKLNFARGQLEKGRIVQVGVHIRCTSLAWALAYALAWALHVRCVCAAYARPVRGVHNACTRHAHFVRTVGARTVTIDPCMCGSPRCTSWTRAASSPARPPLAPRRSWRAYTPLEPYP